MNLTQEFRRIVASTSCKRRIPIVFLSLLSLCFARPSAAQAQVSSLAKVSAVAAPAPSHLGVVPAPAQTRISAVLGREQRPYHATAKGHGFRLENSRQGISAEFTSSGIALRNGSNRWGMRLSEYGYKGELQWAKGVSPHADANRVEYRRAELTEWYLNGPLGLEQGFTFSRAPGKPAGPLMLDLTLSGDLTAALDPGARGLTLQKQGTAVVHYDGLAVTDASGRELPAWLELAENRLSLRVDDSHARYPITVDPLVQAALLTPSDGGMSGGAEGIALGISSDGNTIVVSAPGTSYSTGKDVGAAYVFTKPATGWVDTSSFAAELIASDRGDDAHFGESVGLSSDGNTIVVGSEISKAYVFVNPGSGWTAGCSGTPCALTESTQLISSLVNDSLSFTASISGDGNTVAVGGGDDAFLFLKPAAGWSSASPIYETNVLHGASGFARALSLSADGNILAGGSFLAQIGTNAEQGEVEVFATKDQWQSVSSSQLTASDGVANDQLGSAVAISADGSTIVAGSQTSSYSFVKPGADWGTEMEASKLVGSDGPQGLGRSVGISADASTIIAGAFGAAYVYARPTTGWTSSSPLKETAKLSGTDTTFAAAVAISGDSNTTAASDWNLSDETNAEAHIFTGSAAAPTASLSTSNLTFGNQPVGTTSATQTVMLTNTGTAALHVSAVSASTSFTTTTNCVNASPIAVGGNCSENVAFAPGSVGSSMGTLTFTDDSGGTAGAMQTVNLSGTGVQAATSTTITSASPNPALAGQAVTFSFSVTPPMGDTLTPTGMVTVTASTGENCTGAAPSGSCSITFTSPVTRTITASYAGDTNFKSSTSASVSEQVVDFSLSVSPSSQTIPPGHLASYTLTATSINGFTGTVALVCGAPPQLSCAISPGFLSLSSSTGTAGVTIGANPPRNDKGPYTLTFWGSDGTLVHTATVSLTLK